MWIQRKRLLNFVLFEGRFYAPSLAAEQINVLFLNIGTHFETIQGVKKYALILGACL